MATGRSVFVTTVIETNGATSLTQVGDQFYLDDGTGAGPSLKVFGTDHLAGHGRHRRQWAPIGAEKTATGYEVAWKVAGADQYTVWTTDNNGNYISNIGVVSGSSTALDRSRAASTRTSMATDRSVLSQR